MRLRFRICYLLSSLRIHNPACEHCNDRATCGEEMRQRLEELNWRTQPRSLNNGGSGVPVEASDSKPPKV